MVPPTSFDLYRQSGISSLFHGNGRRQIQLISMTVGSRNPQVTCLQMFQIKGKHSKIYKLFNEIIIDHSIPTNHWIFSTNHKPFNLLIVQNSKPKQFPGHVPLPWLTPCGCRFVLVDFAPFPCPVYPCTPTFQTGIGNYWFFGFSVKHDKAM